MSIEKLRKMPLKTFFQADVTFVPKNPGAFEPKLTKSICRYSTYLVSHNKVVITMQSEGREFTFCDRFSPQFIYIITQSVDPRIEEETDYSRKLSMFSTHIEARGRIQFHKSVGFLKGPIITGGEKAMRQAVQEPLSVLHEILQVSLKQRL